MAGEALKVGNLKQQDNFVPLPYRCVSFQPYHGEFSQAAIEHYLLPREVYRRTDVIVLHDDERQHYAVVAVQRKDSENLFTAIEQLEILALPDDCVFIHDPTTDPANRSALAKTALAHEVGNNQTAIVQGSFDHINIIHRPKPFILRVLEVVPPEPPKLYHLVEQVLGYADLSPVILELETIDLRDLAINVQTEDFLVPCRSGGLENLGKKVHFLDERPQQRQNWTLLGCERSLQFHRHYYGDEPPRVEMCPRQLVKNNDKLTVLKCCLLEFNFEIEGEHLIVPWGADLKMIEQALQQFLAGKTP